jgi:hypothetical protein
MAYDPAGRVVVLFGGAGKGGLNDQTWVWDGSDWSELSQAASPPPLYGATMFYDAAISQVVLFGGDGAGGPEGPFLGTWAWGGSYWAHLYPATHPPASAFSARIGGGLFGGVGPTGQPLSGTWGGPDPTDWWQGPGSPPSARYGAAAAYDQAAGEVVMFGGHSANGLLSGTWAWGSSGWSQLSPAMSPPALYGASMAYYNGPGADQVILFGGVGTSGFLSGTWAWDGTNWSQLHPPESPSARYEAAMAYDPASEQVVMFGGTGPSGVLGSTWTWQVPKWRPA